MLPVPIRRRRSLVDPVELMGRDFNRLMREFWDEEMDAEGGVLGAYPVDIQEQDDKILVDAELPGFTRQEIDISLDKGLLRISAERKQEEKKGKRHLSERRFTRVERMFTLPADVDETKVAAKLEDGVLHLTLPKASESKRKQIKIQ